VRLDGYTSEAARDLLKDVHFTEIKSAEIMNGQISQYYNKPPFIEGGKVGVFETDGTQKFVRVFTEGETEPRGRFMMLEKDLIKLTPLQMKDKFDLPSIPTHTADITPPIGEKIAVGTVEAGNFGGKGKGTQFYNFNQPSDKWVGNIKKIEGVYYGD
jgi:filamentous hemagglutinin